MVQRPRAPDGPALLEFIRERAAACVPAGAADVLDAGAGEGRLLSRLRGARRVVALDLAPRAGSALEVGGDIARLPFPDASFDAVVCINVFNVVSPAVIRDGLAELVRVLRPGGRLVLAAPNLEHPLVRLRAFLWRRRRGAAEPGGLRERRLEAMLSRLGAELVDREWISPVSQASPGLKRRLAGCLAAVTLKYPPLSPHAIWIAAKRRV